MNEAKRSFMISNIDDIIVKNMLSFSVWIAEQIVSFLEEEENKMEKNPERWFNPRYIDDGEKILGVFGIKSTDLFTAEKITSPNGPDYQRGLRIMLRSGAEKDYWFDTKEKRDTFFDKIKAELI